MIKQKKWMTYLLVLLVVFIWGVILWQILAQADTGEVPLGRTLSSGPASEKLPRMQPDTFSLLLNYPDPFAPDDKVPGTGVNVSPVGSASAGQSGLGRITVDIPAPQVKPPANTAELVSYLGFVQNPESKKRIAIINSGGKEMMLSEGETIGELKLISILDGAVTIRIKKQLKQIKQSL